MPKNLVLFSDGTGNSARKLFKTNVWRVYQAVDLADPQDPKQPRQFAFYDDGVGTSSFKPLAVLGGAFGVGLARNIVDLYIFLCRMYEPGDRIFAFGFSRGAFTIRVLIGLVMTEGLLRYHGNEGDLKRLARDAYRAYRAKRFKSNPMVEALRDLRDLGIGVLNRLLRRRHYRDADRIGQPGTADAIEIEFVGLWDTVDAYGLPVDELTHAVDRFIWPLTMRDYNLNKRVRRARHALSIDDERNAFHPRLWNEVPDPSVPDSGVPGSNLDTRHVDDERISQVWFAGVHSNVGGGYPDDSLSYVSLLWILQEARKYGLRFEPSIWQEQEALSDENGRMYDSRRGLAGYYRYNPRRIEQLADTRQVKVARTKVHESVLRRIRAGHDGYAPIVLPPGFAVMRIDGRIVAASDYLREADPGGEPAAAGPAAAAAPAFDAAAYARDVEVVFTTVWRRRVAYFATLAVTLALLAMPLMAPGTSACTSALCFVSAPIVALGALLPSFTGPWIESYASQPGAFLLLAGALMLGIRRGQSLEAKIRDQMRRLWYANPSLKPVSATGMPPPAVASRWGRLVQSMRRSALYVASLRFVARGLMPSAFLLVILYGAVALASQLDFAMRSSAGAVCREEASKTGWFDTRSKCWNTGVEAREGATYRVRISVPASARWLDDAIAAGPHGFECALPAGQALVMGGTVLLRRHLAQPWFQPMARIGAMGSDTYALRGSPSTAPLHDRCGTAAPSAPSTPSAGCPSGDTAGVVVAEAFESVFVARSSGPLFLYVNDAVDVRLLRHSFYANNRGCAKVEVATVLPASSPKAAGGSP